MNARLERRLNIAYLLFCVWATVAVACFLFRGGLPYDLERAEWLHFIVLQAVCLVLMAGTGLWIAGMERRWTDAVVSQSVDGRYL